MPLRMARASRHQKIKSQHYNSAMYGNPTCNTPALPLRVGQVPFGVMLYPLFWVCLAQLNYPRVIVVLKLLVAALNSAGCLCRRTWNSPSWPWHFHSFAHLLIASVSSNRRNFQSLTCSISVHIPWPTVAVFATGLTTSTFALVQSVMFWSWPMWPVLLPDLNLVQKGLQNEEKTQA